MKVVRVLMVWLLVLGLSSSAFAGDLQASLAKAAEQQAKPSSGSSMPKGYLVAGSALFVGGMTLGLYAFLNNRNGSLPDLGEGSATNKPLGAAGLGLAFVGGTVLFLGSRAGNSPTVTFGPGRMTVSKKVSW
ncbi:MAG: hypothetical protein HYZ58_07895 [Acidobacteria bacterium]|nr:hypothetical protein [Acidobacteriota bacterium]MBI3263058.1 hypothetical protein [Acidobacteriota bacterium]